MLSVTEYLIKNIDKMIKTFIYYNRKLTSSFVGWFNYMLGNIDNCEEVFYSYINTELSSKTIVELGGTNRPPF